MFRGVPKSLPEAGHGGIESVLKVYEGVTGPEAAAEFVASYDFSWFFE
jgi:hypothetical protein